MSETCPRCGFVAPSGALSLCPRCLLAEDPAEAGAGIDDIALPGLSLERALGQGGMGRVFLARHVRLGREVAVKVLANELRETPVFRERFEREARALARLSHPNIVAVHDFGVTEDGAGFLVMEYVPGGTLADRIPLAPERAVEVALQICDALEAAHASGIVHRDLKPENILFDSREQVKLADFGVARLLDLEDEEVLTHPALVLGTPVYMAPEARTGAPPDPRMDLYSVGVLLREMVTGRPQGAGPLPTPLTEVVARATEERLERRVGSASELRRLLASLSRAPRTRPELLPPEEQSWQRAVALAFAAATAVGLYAFVTSFTPRVLDDGSPTPLLVLGTKTLPDGRTLVLSHFETWPTLAGAAAFAVALASYGMLRRHWRTHGFDRPAPDQPVETSNAVFYLGLGLFGVFGAHRLLDSITDAVRGISPYMPVFGGMFEFVLLYLVCLSVLEAIRIERPLRKEPKLWIGFALGLVPPSSEFFRALAAF